MRTRKKYRKGELASRILFFISAGAAIPAILVVPNMAKVLLPALHKWAKKLESPPQVFQKSLTSLKRNRLLDIKEKGGETIFTLTERGQKRLIKGDFDTLSITMPKKWDKKWRLVLFDVPHDEKNARDALRMKLRELGLFQLQKSCFIYPYECRNEIDFVTEFFGISHYVNYLIVESLEGEDHLREFFEI